MSKDSSLITALAHNGELKKINDEIYKKVTEQDALVIAHTPCFIKKIGQLSGDIPREDTHESLNRDKLEFLTKELFRLNLKRQ